MTRPGVDAEYGWQYSHYFDDSDDELLGGDSDEESEGFEGEDSD